MQSPRAPPRGAAAAAADQPVRRSDPASTSSGARSVRPTWAAASTTSPSSKAIPSHVLRRLRHRRRLEDDEQRHDVDADLRRATRCRRSATSRSRRRIPTSSTSAPASRTTARARRSAPASTSRPTPARPSKYVGLKDTQSIARIVVHPKDPEHRLRRGARTPVRTEPGARPLQDDRRRQDLDEHQVHRRGHRLHRRGDGSRRIPTCSSPRRTSAGARRGASTAADRAAACGRRPTAGKTWTKLTGNGLPDNPMIGRIGLDIARSKPSTIYASIEVGPSGGTGAGVNDDGTLRAAAGSGGGGGGGGGAGTRRLPLRIRTKSGIWRSDDGGKTWRFLSNQGDRWMYYSQIRVDPDQPRDRVPGRRAVLQDHRRRQDVAARCRGIPHSDHHAIWIDPRERQPHAARQRRRPRRQLRPGGDLGVREHHAGRPVLRDQRRHAEAVLRVRRAAGQRQLVRPERDAQPATASSTPTGSASAAATASTPPNDPTRLDASSTRSRRTARPTASISRRPEHQHPAARPGRPRRARRAAAGAGRRRSGGTAGAQFGFGRGNAERQHRAGAAAPGTNYRFYWNTPFILSPHNPRTIYLGGDRLFRSYDRGDTWMASPDLTNNIGRNDRPIMGVDGNGADGVEARRRRVLQQHHHHQRILRSCPASSGSARTTATFRSAATAATPGRTSSTRCRACRRRRTSRASRPSHFDAGTAYVTFDGHRTDDHKPYVFKTTDFGETWTSIAANLPEGNVNVIREDPKNRNLLYLGTEYGFYVSLDGGREWKRFMNGLPTVRIDDILVHPRDNDLIVATHGRSIYDHGRHLGAPADADGRDCKTMRLFDVRPAVAWTTDIQKCGAGRRGETLPGAESGARIGDQLLAEGGA